MLEYGYLYKDAEAGVFRSRFAPSALEQADRNRAVTAARVLNRFRDESTYPAFLKYYTPMSDPFIHEARVHLFRRDRHFSWAMEVEKDPDEYARILTIAWRENRIMEKYFSNTLHHSDYVWPEEKSTLARRHVLPGVEDESVVSWKLITRIDEWMVVCLLMVLILSLLLLYLYFGKMPNSKLPSDL